MFRISALLFATGFLLLAVARPLHAHSTKLLLDPVGEAGELLGISAGTAGDVNGDGYADVIVGAPGMGAGFGRAYVYFGGPAADTIADLTLTGEAAGDFFGISVGTAGDVNGDGYADVIVGADGYDAGTHVGRAYVYFGGPAADTIADLTLTGEAAGDNFGFSVGTAGDVNGDGYADVIVGANGYDAGTFVGRAYVYFGGPAADTIADLTLTGEAASDEFGESVGTAGDVNGDGYADVIVGANGYDAGTHVGRAYVYFGGPAADTIADLTLTGEAAGDFFGESVGTAGDVNGDGYADVIVGAAGYDAGTSAGRAYVYFGGPGADTIADLTLTGEAAGDEFGISVGTAGDVNGDGYADVIVGAWFGTDAGRMYVYYGGPAADTIADLTLTGEAADDQFGNSVGTAGDVNGDGYDDVIVGAWMNDSGGSNSGKAYVYSVFPYEILSPTAGDTWVAGQNATVHWLGHEVADVAISADGGLSWSPLASGVGGSFENQINVVAPGATDFARIRVTEMGEPPTNSNSALSEGVFRIVAPSDPPPVACQLLIDPTGVPEDELGYSVAGAGDVNGDGFADVIVGAPFEGTGGTDAGAAYIYYRGPDADDVADRTLSGTTMDRLGHSVAGAGDVNGDGFADVIVGAPFNDAGKAIIHFGGPVVTDFVLTGEAAGDEFGGSVAGAGDVNGDGFDDVIVGASLNGTAGASAGRAYVFFGGPSVNATADLTLTGAATSDRFGFSVSGAGDVDGDGFSDMIVGAYGAGDPTTGLAYLFHGGPDADETADLVLPGQGASDHFGISVGGAGDVNHDGFDDVIVGATRNDAGGDDAGRAYVYLGGPGIGIIPDLTLNSEAAGDEFGTCVGGAGDANGDGFADVIVGAPFNDATGTGAGRAYVFFGSPVPDATADVTLTGEAGGGFFGSATGGAGDVSGDGFDDLIVGARLDGTAGTKAGRAFVYDCNRYFVLDPNGGETWNVGAVETVSWLGIEPADVWLSADGGRTYDLLAAAAVSPLPVLAPHKPTHFATVRLTPSDLTLPGGDRSDSLFTIESSITLVSFGAAFSGGGGSEAAIRVTWQTEPGPDDLAGYRLEKSVGFGGPGVARDDWHTLVARTKETTHVDAESGAGATYRLTAINGLGQEYVLGETSIGPVSPLAAAPLPYRTGALNIRFAAVGGFGSGAGPVELTLFDVTGRRVRTLVERDLEQGYHVTTWDGRDADGHLVGSGVYFLRLVTSGSVRSTKVVVAR